MKNKILLKIKYPKFLFLLLVYLITVIFFYNEKTNLSFHNFFSSFAYFGIFLAGIFYAYGFTAAPATALLLILAKQHSFLSAGIIGGVGALLSDVIIFMFVRHSFIDEIEKLKKEKIIILIGRTTKKLFGLFSNYLLPIISGFLIASPLPTEVGVALLATMKGLSVKKFLLIAYLLHTLGILIILFIGNSI